MMGTLVKVSCDSEIREKFIEVCAYAGSKGFHLGHFVMSQVEQVIDRAKNSKDPNEKFKQLETLADEVKKDKTIVIDFEYRIGKWDSLGMYIQENFNLSPKKVMTGALIKAIIEIDWDIKEMKDISVPAMKAEEPVVIETSENTEPDKQADKALNEETIRKFCEDMSLVQIKGLIDEIFDAGLVSFNSLEKKQSGSAKTFKEHIVEETLKNALSMLRIFKKYKKVQYSIIENEVKVQ